MTDIDGGKTSSLFTDLKDLREEISGIRADIRNVTVQNASPVSQATNTNHFGGIGVWVAVWVSSLCCTAMLALCFAGGFWMAHQAKQIDDLNAYLQAIYQQAPSLQPPKDDKQ